MLRLNKGTWSETLTPLCEIASGTKTSNNLTKIDLTILPVASSLFFFFTGQKFNSS